jgi:hypothetical protein
MAQLRIRVGAAIDRSMNTAFQPLIESARKARGIIDAELNRSAQTRARTTRTQVSEEQRAASEAAKAKIKAARDAEREAIASARRSAAQFEQASKREIQETKRAEEEKQKAKDRARKNEERANELARRKEQREQERVRRAEEREVAVQQRRLAQYERQSGRQSAFAGERSRQQFASLGGAARGAMVSGIMSAGGFVASRAVSLGADMARGLGYQFDVGQYMAKSSDLEKRAVDLSNASYMPGERGPAGVRQDPAQLMREAQDAGSFAGLDSNKAMEGLQAFVGKTGDLETGRAILKDMAMLSRATGASMDDMVSAAADVSNGLGNTDNKAEKVSEVMKAVAAQGKKGAVEIKDLASQMAKVQAAAGGFEGDGAANIAKLNAIAQMSRAKGGSASATQAATSTLSFANTFSKSARIKAFAEMGVNIRGEGGKTRDPMEVIKDAILAAGSAKNGGMANFDLNMGRMFMDVRARSATRGFEQIYKEAGGGEAGMEAVSRAMRELEGATMSQAEISDSFARSMRTSEAQAQVFNNEMQKLSGELRTALAPALQSLSPIIVAAAQSFASAIAMLTGNKAAGERRDTIAGQFNALNSTNTLNNALRQGKVTKKDMTDGRAAEDALKAQIVAKHAEVERLKGADRRMGMLPHASMIDHLVGTKEARGVKQKAAVAEEQRMQAELTKLQAINERVVQALSTGVLKVEVVKEPPRPSALPGVDPAGRSRDPSNPER